MERDRIQIIASQRLVELLSKINHKISHVLLDEIRNRNSYVISYLDFGDSSDAISFIYSNKVDELYRTYEYKYTEKVWKEKRSDMKVGKIIKMLFGDYFPVNIAKGSVAQKLPNDIETFVNMFKAERDKNENYDRFSIVSGEDIVFWYNVKNYTRFSNEGTPLGKSCLRYEDSGKFLELYRKNPDKVSMLILKDDQGKLRGRALVWNLNNPVGRVYMDRIYTVNDYDIELFKDYARRNGWLYKERQTYGWNNVIVDGRNESLHTPASLIMDVILSNTSLKYYPYVDTLSIYNKETGKMCNDGKLLKTHPHIHLIDYQGSYVDEVDNRPRVYSRYYDDDILRDEAVYCQIDDDWVYQDDSVYVHNTGGLRAIKGTSNIVRSEILGKRKYFIANSCVYSEYLNTYIFKDSSVTAFLDKEKTQQVIIHFKMIGRGFIEDESGDVIKSDKPINIKKKDDSKIKFINVDSLPGALFQVRSHPTQLRPQSTEEEGDGSHMDIPRRRRRNISMIHDNNDIPREDIDIPDLAERVIDWGLNEPQEQIEIRTEPERPNLNWQEIINQRSYFTPPFNPDDLNRWLSITGNDNTND